MSCVEEVVYQAVTPGEPEQNGRCCLNGVGVVFIVIAGVVVLADISVTIGPEVVGPLIAGRLELDVSGKTRKK